MPIHPAGTVLPFLSAAWNVTTRIGDGMHMCRRFRVLCSDQIFFSISGYGPLLFFACASSIK